MNPLPAKFPAKGIQALLPGCCTACGKWPAHGLCDACYTLFKQPKNRCCSCAIELPDTRLSVCGYCLKQPFAFNHTIAAVSYISPWKELVQNLKFYKRTDYGHSVAQLMHLALNTDQDLPLLPDLMLPIPVANLRLQERGFNQSWQIARHLCLFTQIAATPHVLQHARQESLVQTSQTQRTRKERFRALKGAFFINEKYHASLQGKNIVLIDDVMTTGATLHHAALALKKAGAKHVSAWVFARTPEQRVH